MEYDMIWYNIMKACEKQRNRWRACLRHTFWIRNRQTDTEKERNIETETMKEMESTPEAAILNQAGCQKSQIVASLPAGSPLLPLPPGSDSRLAVYGTCCPRWRRSLDRSQDKAGLEIEQPAYQGRPDAKEMVWATNVCKRAAKSSIRSFWL